MSKLVNTDVDTSRKWNVEEIIDGLQDLISPLQTYGGICFKYIETIDESMKNPNPPDTYESLQADLAFYQVAVDRVQNGLSLIRDLVDWMQTLPTDDVNTP